MLETLAFFWSFFFSEEATAFRLPELPPRGSCGFSGFSSSFVLGSWY